MGALESTNRFSSNYQPRTDLQSDNPFSLTTSSENNMSRRISTAISLRRLRGTTSSTTQEQEAGSSSSSASASTSPPVSPKNHMWCYVRAKTKQHNSSKVVNKSVWYENKEGAAMMIGRHESCGLRLDDDRCSSINAKLAPSPNPESSSIILYPEARMYRLVGNDRTNVEDNMNIITLGSVIKVGSVSLEVTALCTDSHDDFYERFYREIDTGIIGTNEGKSSAQRKSTQSETEGSIADKLVELSMDTELDNADQVGSTENINNSNENRTHEPTGKMNVIQRTIGSILRTNSHSSSRTSIRSGTPATDPEPVKHSIIQDDGEDDSIGSVDGTKFVADNDDVMCYICWGGVEPSGGGAKGNENPLIRNPCGKCSGSSQYVHLQCILTWIESSGSGHCSICNGPLPQHFASPPPNIELKVVRHRRGESWVGTRRYRVNFRKRSVATIGRESDVEIRLGDRSVCPKHARIAFDEKTRQFRLFDYGSTTGTYMLVQEPVELLPSKISYFKIGRTNLSMRVSQKRNSILPSYLQWGNH